MRDSKVYINDANLVARFSPEPKAADLRIMQYGDMLFIICADHDTRGCGHVKYAFEKSLDHKVFDYVMYPTRVEIPISTKDGLWEYVYLTDAHPQFGHREVQWTNPHGQLVSLGVLNEGDGRRVVQDMLFEYYHADKLATTKCKNSLHGHPAEMLWKDIMEVSPKTQQMIAKWTVYVTNWCLWCTREQEKAMADPNVVPTGQGW